MAERTKGPWKVEGHKIIDAHNNDIAEITRFGADFAPQEWATPKKHWQANAEFIVQACNAHDALVGALSDIHDIINTYSHIPNLFKACMIAQAALEAAKGE